MSLRSRVLQRCFNLLYGPLVFLHEPAGRVLGGASWHARRVALLSGIPPGATVLDIGCGEGRLLREAARRGARCLGIDPSRAMLNRARQTGLPVVQARAERLPIRDATVSAIVITYPGPWIRDPAAWQEFGRVLKVGGTISILLGGTVTRGSGNLIRRLMSRVAYGSVNPDRLEFNPPVGNGMAGALTPEEDRWGTVFIWRGIVRQG